MAFPSRKPCLNVERCLVCICLLSPGLTAHLARPDSLHTGVLHAKRLLRARPRVQMAYAAHDRSANQASKFPFLSYGKTVMHSSKYGVWGRDGRTSTVPLAVKTNILPRTTGRSPNAIHARLLWKHLFMSTSTPLVHLYLGSSAIGIL